jgi:hypothetical protein
MSFQLVSKFVSSKKIAEQTFEPFSSKGDNFGGVFDRSPDNKQALQEFSSFGGVPTSPQPPAQLNF